MRSSNRVRRGLAAVLAAWVVSAASGDAAQPKAPGFSCPANAKPANLNLTFKDLSGKDVSLSSFKGRVILLDFWATWCAPCKVEIPWFVEYQKRLGPQGFQVVGVSVDDDFSVVKPFATRLGMNYPVLHGAGRQDIQDAYGPLEVFPTTVLISREGKICAAHIGLTEKSAFDTQIAALLKGSR